MKTAYHKPTTSVKLIDYAPNNYLEFYEGLLAKETLPTAQQERVFVFIDNANVHLATQALGWRMGWENLHEYLRVEHKATKIVQFLGYLQERQGFYSFLYRIGYELDFMTKGFTSGGKVKANVDSHLIVAAMKQVENYDRALIFSGDGDFVPLYEYLQERGKLGKIIVPSFSSKSSKLDRFGDLVTSTELLRASLEYKSAPDRPAQKFRGTMS